MSRSTNRYARSGVGVPPAVGGASSPCPPRGNPHKQAGVGSPRLSSWFSTMRGRPRPKDAAEAAAGGAEGGAEVAPRPLIPAGGSGGPPGPGLPGRRKGRTVYSLMLSNQSRKIAKCFINGNLKSSPNIDPPAVSPGTKCSIYDGGKVYLGVRVRKTVRDLLKNIRLSQGGPHLEAQVL